MIKSYIYNIICNRSRGVVPGLIRLILLFLSYIYGLIIRIKSYLSLHNKKNFNCKVISVGNITWGGTGKTVVVEHIARFLRSQGRRVAVVSWGYKRVTSVGLGDEPQMLKDKLVDIAVVSNSDRQAGIKRAIREFAADTVILDDGFQQWGINKDMDIVTIDANNPFGSRQMIPRGILREPLGALKRAGLFLITKCNFAPDILELKNFLKNINPQAQLVLSIHKGCGFVELSGNGRVVQLEELLGKKVVLASGIADPEFFEKMVSSQPLTILGHIKFDDHHNYSGQDVEKIISLVFSQGADAVITTEKDAVKLKDIFSAQTAPPVYSLKVELEITQNEEEFHRRLLRACAG